MSSQWTVHCDTCDEDGPDLRRQAGGTVLIDPDEWTAFLIEHNWHRLELHHE